MGWSGKKIRGIIIITGSVISAGVIIYLLIRLAPDPPVGDVEYAREMLSRASSSKADTYSRQLFSEARADYESAMEYWRRENEKFIFFRKYDIVSQYAKSSSEKSKKAAHNSISNSNSLMIKLKEKIEQLNNTASELDSLFGRYPLTSELRSRISRGRMLLKEGEVAYGKGQYLLANRKITDSDYLLTGVYENATTMLKDYFKDFDKWKKWAQKAISDSKKSGSYAILVDKLSRKCYIYLAGIKKYEFEAELGRNWVGDKIRMGDKATPEGMYKITNKLQGRATQYYKALAIDYPNAEDKERFRNAIETGELPSTARIGSGIQIHGGGGKGVDWTEGCVALRNEEMDKIFNLVRVGTPVTIVGSLKEIDKILD